MAYLQPPRFVSSISQHSHRSLQYSSHLPNSSTCMGVASAHPNPQTIVKCDSEIGAVFHAFRALYANSGSVVSRSILHSLEYTSFNHLQWDEAHLLWFVRHMLFQFPPPGIRRHAKNCGLSAIIRQSYIDAVHAWLESAWLHYNRVPFHNFEHAFAVTQMMFVVLTTLQRQYGCLEDNQSNVASTTSWGCLSHLVQWCLLVAALCHDLDHTGFNNAYQVNASTELKERYGHESTLERHHCNMTMNILHDAHCKPMMDAFTTEEKKFSFALIESVILSTDMARHGSIVKHFQDTFLNQTTLPSPPSPSVLLSLPLDPTLEVLCQCFLKACDISNEVRPVHISEVWLDRLLAEFFAQSDHEKDVGLPVAPFMDREKVAKCETQVGFCKFIILPLFEALSQLLPPLEEVLVSPVRRQVVHYIELSQEKPTPSLTNQSSTCGNVANSILKVPPHPSRFRDAH